VLPSGQTLTLGLLATVTHFLEISSCEPFCLDRLNLVKRAAFQLYLQSGKQKSRIGGGEVILFLATNPLVEEGVREGALSSRNSQLFRRHNLGRSLRTFPQSRGKTSQ
jgi:hypothetical protein